MKNVALLLCLITNRPVGTTATVAELNNLAATHYRQAHYKEAEHLWLQAIASSCGVEKATIASNLAALYRRTSHFDRAHQYFLLNYTLRRDALGPDHTDTAIALNNLADLKTTLARYDEAERDFRIALTSRNITREDRAAISNNLGNLLRVVGRFEEAHFYLDANLKGQVDLFHTYHNLGRLAEDQEQFAEAFQFYHAALALAETPAILANLSHLHLQSGNQHEARKLLDKALRANPSGQERAFILQSMEELLLAVFH